MIRIPTDSELRARIGIADPVTGVTFPQQGLQPYYTWLLGTLNQLLESSAGPLKVWRDDGGDTKVYIAPGRCSIGGTALAHAGSTMDLASLNNDTAYIWITNVAGVATPGFGADASGWPVGAHLKLAEVTLWAGQITTILDRRFDTILSA